MATGTSSATATEASASFTQELEQQIDLEAKRKLRQENLAAAGKQPSPEDDFFSKMDASIKKNTAFVKKLKEMTDKQKDSLLKEAKTLKAHKYITEAVAAIGECKLKQKSDIDAAIQICSVFHQRYTEFTPLLQTTLLKILKVPTGEKETERLGRLTKQRITIRFVAELFLVGIFTNYKVVYQPLLELLTQEKDLFSNVSIAVNFAKYNGIDFTGIIPSNTKDASLKKMFETGEVLTAEQQQMFAKLLQDYFANVVSPKLLEDHKALKQMERENHNTIMSRGDLTEEQKANYEKALKNYDKIMNNAQILSECINRSMPEFPPDEGPTRVTVGGGVFKLEDNRPDDEKSTGVWDDEEAQSFYEDLKDLKAYMPAILIEQQDSSKQTAKKEESSTEAKTPTTEDSTLVEGDLSENAIGKEKETDAADKPTDKPADKPTDKPTDKTTDKPEVDYHSEDQLLAKKLGELDVKESNVSNDSQVAMDIICAKLPNCVNRDLIDKISEEYYYINSKNNRRRLIKCLLSTSRGRLDLIPYYCRLIATLNKCFEEIGQLTIETLDEEFEYFMRKRQETSLEGKIKTIRFIAELTKFGVYPVNSTFMIMKRLLDEFMHHNIDVLCNLLENCGRFLKRTRATEVRMTNMLEILQRKKNMLHLDARQQVLVENAYYQCIPPERKVVTVVRPPMHEFIRYLLYVRLNRKNVDDILDLIKRLDWNDKKLRNYLLKKFVSIWKVKYAIIPYVASIVSGLQDYHNDFVVELVDSIMEEIRVGLEQNDYRHNQRRIAVVKYLAELYNFVVVDSNLIFDTLHSILSFGHETGWPDPERHSNLDPPKDYFRCRLVCTILDTCGEYFCKGTQKIKLNSFLKYFQRYILAKGEIPQDVEFLVLDTIEELKPNFKFYSSLEEAVQEVANLEKEVLLEIQARKQGIIREVKMSDDDNEDDEEESDDEKKSTTITRTGKNMEDESEESDLESSSKKSLEDESDESDESDSSQEEEEDDFDEEPEVLVFRNDTSQKSLEEDDEFEKEFSKVMSESFDVHRRDTTRGSLDVNIPMNMYGKRDDQGNQMFGFLTRRSNKPHLKPIIIPSENTLALNIKAKKEEELEEQKKLKQLVLGLAEEVNPSSVSHYDPKKAFPAKEMDPGADAGGKKTSSQKQRLQQQQRLNQEFFSSPSSSSSSSRRRA